MTPVRYAVVGLGHIAQAAVLPAFAHAPKNSLLTALVSDTPVKQRKLSDRYKVPCYSYAQYGELLHSGTIDAVYIALPNTLHKEYSVRAAEAGIHVLCEKPMATSVADCQAMIQAAARHRVKLMIAYRLHFDAANLTAMKIAQSGKIGEPRFFSSTFSLQVTGDNIRTNRELGGGSVWDLGIYCLNAARYLFKSEPMEVSAFSARKKSDPRFREIEEMTSVQLRFPGERLATFTSSFGAADSGAYDLVGTKGSLRLDPGYEYYLPITLTVKVGAKVALRKTFAKRDQFAAELVYFSDCIRQDKTVEPSGLEGLADVRVIEAIYRSARTHRPVALHSPAKRERPTLRQEIHKPPVPRVPALVQAESSSGD